MPCVPNPNDDAAPPGVGLSPVVPGAVELGPLSAGWVVRSGVFGRASSPNGFKAPGARGAGLVPGEEGGANEELAPVPGDVPPVAGGGLPVLSCAPAMFSQRQPLNKIKSNGREKLIRGNLVGAPKLDLWGFEGLPEGP